MLYVLSLPWSGEGSDSKPGQLLYSQWANIEAPRFLRATSPLYRLLYIISIYAVWVTSMVVRCLTNNAQQTSDADTASFMCESGSRPTFQLHTVWIQILLYKVHPAKFHLTNTSLRLALVSYIVPSVVSFVKEFPEAIWINPIRSDLNQDAFQWGVLQKKKKSHVATVQIVVHYFNLCCVGDIYGGQVFNQKCTAN